ncbi:unnamed protein product [Rotaria sordida]|uniref:Uncharacterized protein n=1 Tax=Rotaria sordida TaxID=392033 RepID=A0A813X719_9BILA|nr:unnamed protein product [Rotaria sordida]
MSSPKSSFSMALITRLMLYLEFPVRASIVALTLVERWYSHMKMPVIKISQIDHQLDHDPITGDIQWNQQSIKILLENIERVIQKRELPSSIIDDSLIPWQTERTMHLCR